MDINADEIKKYIQQAESLFREQKYEETFALLNSIIKKYPSYAPTYKVLALALINKKREKESIPYLKQAITLVPDSVEYWRILAEVYKICGDWQGALHSFRTLEKLQGSDRGTCCEIAQMYYITKEYTKALEILGQLEITTQDSIELIALYARVLKHTKGDEIALEQYQILIDRDGANVDSEILTEWYNTIESIGEDERLLIWLEEQAALHKENPTLKYLYGKKLLDRSRLEEGIPLVEDAFTLIRDNAEIPCNLAVAHYISGDKKRTKEYCEEALKINPLHSASLRLYGLFHRYHYGDLPFRRLNFASLYTDEMPQQAKSQMYYALGKAYDDVEELDTAFECYKRGGIFHSSGENSNYQELKLTKEKFTKKLDGSLFASTQTKGHRSNKPIFVIGMPRSGTTLLEQVLSSIDGVYGAGELEYLPPILHNMQTGGVTLDFGIADSTLGDASYEQRGMEYLSMVEKLAPHGSQRVIDKMPDNFKWLAPIKLILPDAYFIHARRHPIETCLSAYRLYFTEGHDWSDDLQTIGRYYRLYRELMDHWKQILPEGSMTEVRYEDMISDLESESKRIAEYIDMPWSPTCLEFHKSQRAVKTASASQVRQPLYTSSTNRWHKYEPYLKPLLDEIGDLVEEYEAELQPN